MALSNHIALSVGQLGYLMREGAMWWQDGTIAFANVHSYTTPDFEVQNHHWLAGVIFYGLQQWIGYGGLHVLAVLSYVALFLGLYRYTIKGAIPIVWQLIIGLLAVPLFTMHNLVDAIFFTYILVGIYWLLLSKSLDGKYSPKWLLLLPVLQMIWVNTHQYFWIGWALIVLALIQATFTNRGLVKWLLPVLLATVASAVLHPQGLQGLTTALQTAFVSPAIMPIQEQPTWAAYLLTQSYSLLYVLVVSGILLLGIINWVGIASKQQIASFWQISTSVLLTLLALWSNQLAPLLLIPFFLIAFANVQQYYTAEDNYQQLLRYCPPSLVLYLLVPVFVAAGYYNPIANLGYGLRGEEQKITNFINKAGIQGPIFHNTAISGLLVSELEQPQPLYISSQPQAHPTNFYQQDYFPTILSPMGWKTIHDQYQFNAIVIRLQGMSIPQLQFMGNLLGNGRWSMVYLEPDYEVILIKKTPKNQIIIDRFNQVPDVIENQE